MLKFPAPCWMSRNAPTPYRTLAETIGKANVVAACGVHQSPPFAMFAHLPILPSTINFKWYPPVAKDDGIGNHHGLHGFITRKQCIVPDLK